MRIIRGNYDGASEFAYFDKPIQEMTLDECRSLLLCITHRSAPGEINADLMFKELSIAEQIWKEQEP